MTDDRRPWWVWRAHPAPPKRLTTTVRQVVGKRTRVYEQPLELMLQLPYQRDDRAYWGRLGAYWGRLGQRSTATNAEVNRWNDARVVIRTWLNTFFGPDVAPGRAMRRAYGAGGEPVDFAIGRFSPADGFGSMLVVNAHDVYTKNDEARRSQRYDFVVTPPVFMFCDLTGTFDFAAIGPTTFWIQPEVYEATGEIMQGSPVGQVVKSSTTGRTSSRDVKHALTNRDLQSALSGWPHDASGGMEKAARVVTVALDAFLERGAPDPRFVDPDRVYQMSERDPF